jgi:RHS repeat-associated protein
MPGPSCDVNGQSGALPSYSFERFALDDRSQLAVNLCSGNLLIEQRVLTIPGVAGQNLNIDQVYNPGRAGLVGNWNLNVDLALAAVNDPTPGSEVLFGDSGYRVWFARHADGSFARVPGLHATLTENSDGTFTLLFDQTRAKWNFNGAGEVTSTVDRNGNTITFHYSSTSNGDRLSSITDSENRVTKLTLSNAEITKITDPTGTVAGSYHYGLDTNGFADMLTQFTNRAGQTYSYTYSPDPTAPLATLTGLEGQVYSFSYDSALRVTQVSLHGADGVTHTESFAYATDSAKNSTTTETDPNNHVTTYHFNAQGQQTSAVDTLGHTKGQTWTANGDIQTTTDGLNNSTTASFDSLHNEISSKLPTGATNTIGYTNTALPHAPTSFKDPAGNQTTYSYDSKGNLTSVHAAGIVAAIDTRTYNTNGTVNTDTDGNGNVTQYSYDPAGNLTSYQPPAPRTATHYGYDALSRLTSVTDGNGVEIDYGYDALDRITSIGRKGGAVVETQAFDPNGDVRSRETANDSATFSYSSSLAGDLIASAAQTRSGGTTTVTYAYDPAGNLTGLSEADGTTTYHYDAADRLTSMADPFGQTTTFGYDAADRRTSVTWPGAGTETLTYDGAGRETALTVANTSGTQLLHNTYNFQTASGVDSGLLQSRTDSTGTTSYTYDSLARLTHAGSTSFTYDNAGNLTNLGGVAQTYNAPDELVQTGGTTIGYDAQGNPTSTTNPSATLSYSPTNQLASVTGTNPLTATYDTVDQTQPSVINEADSLAEPNHSFTSTALGVTEVRDTAAGGVTRPIEVRTTDVARDPKGTLITQQVNGGLRGARSNVVTDYQGSVVALVSTTGTLTATFGYTPYGTPTASNPGDGFGYAGTFRLGNGEDLMGYRYYNPAQGRFTQPDPTSQEANPYAYAADDPVNNTDPTGGTHFSSVGEYGRECAKGAVVGLGIGLLGVDETVVGALGEAAGGCVEGLFGKFFDDLTDSDVGSDASNVKDAIDLFTKIAER